MVEEMVIKAVKRAAAGSGAARRLRRAGQIPAVVYGDSAPRSIEVNAHDFALMLQHHGENFVADLLVEGEGSLKVLLKDVQHDPRSGDITHADLMSISMTEMLDISLPIDLVGEPAGIVTGGVLEQLISELEVRCLPGDMVEVIEIDVSALQIGDHLTVADVTLPKGLTMLTEPDVAVAGVTAPRTEEEEAEAEPAEAEAVAVPDAQTPEA